MRHVSRLPYGFLTLLCACILIFLVAGPVRLQAQQSGSGVLNGTVLDPDGNAVQNAIVVARSESTAATAKTSTDLQGKFSVTGLAAGSYTVDVSLPGFAQASRPGVQVSADQPTELSISLSLGSVTDAITVEANASGSLAAQHAPMDGLLEARSARTEVTPVFIQNFTAPTADFGELVEMAPGTVSVSSNGIGLGQDKTFFRGFPDGDYDIDFDGVPFYDTNTPRTIRGHFSRHRGWEAWTSTGVPDRLRPSGRHLLAARFTCSRRQWITLHWLWPAFRMAPSTRCWWMGVSAPAGLAARNPTLLRTCSI